MYNACQLKRWQRGIERKQESEREREKEGGREEEGEDELKARHADLAKIYTADLRSFTSVLGI